MKKITMSAVALTAIMGSFSSVSAADGINILDDINVKGQIRPRYEAVDDGNTATENASAFTARTKLNASAKLFGMDGLTTNVGIITVNNFGYHEYNWNASNYTTDSGKRYSTVMDPQFAMISNAEINYKAGKTLLHAGRGQVNLDNQRFIGTVGWRQLERSYDTVFLANNSVKNLSVLVAWVYGYQGVVEGETVDTNSVLLHAAYKVSDALNITVYDYMLANIHDTMGIALTGKVNMGAKLSYRLEYAAQGDATMEKGVQTPATGKASASYMNIDVGANFSGVIAGVNYELLSGTDNASDTAFTTPLATGHKFNGWADKFLGTPTGGLQDMNLRVGYKAKGFGKVLAVYHQFTADKTMATATGTGDDLGTELDLLYANKVPGFNGLSGLVKYAAYSGGTVVGYTNDVSKLWLGLDYKFSTK